MMRKKRNRQLNRRALRVESLERREVLAGNVTATLIGATLVINGDGADNQVAVISLGNSRYAVAGVDTTINGAAGSFVTPRTTLNITANLNAGNDALGLSNNVQALADLAQDNFGIDVTNLGVDIAALQALIDAATNVTRFSLAGNLTVNGGTGNDVIGVVGDVGGSVVASLGTANGGFNAFGYDGSSLIDIAQVGGSLSVYGDRQADEVAVVSTQVRGSVVASLSDGDNALTVETALIGGSVAVSALAGSDLVNVEGSTVTGLLGVALGEGRFNELSVKASHLGALSYTGGSGIDSIDTAATSVATNATLVTFGGADSVLVHEHGAGGTNVAGLLSISTGAGDDEVEVSGNSGVVTIDTADGIDKVQVYDSHITTNLTISTGNQTDNVSLDSVLTAIVSIYLGEGNDKLDVTDLTVTLNALLLAGGGDDVVTIDATDVGFTFTALLEGGNDTITITDSSATTAVLNGGLGTDTLNVDAATLAAVDFVFKSLFEVENVI
ncbi:MAG: hypothetical protein U0935_09700 [Pirellulales bacterium]